MTGKSIFTDNTVTCVKRISVTRDQFCWKGKVNCRFRICFRRRIGLREILFWDVATFLTVNSLVLDTIPECKNALYKRQLIVAFNMLS